MLNRAVQRNLMAKAHQLRPVVMIGQKGLTENIHQEVEAALLAHELIKIRITAPTREDRGLWIEEITQQHKANLVQLIGHIAVLYRKNPGKKKAKK